MNTTYSAREKPIMPTSTRPPEQLLAQAVALMNANNGTGAAELLHGILAEAPDFAPAHHLLGLLALAAGNLAQAAELIEKAIAHDPSSALFHRNLGEVCRRLGRLDDAIVAGKKTCELAPGNAEAHLNLGLAFFDQGHLDEAIDSYRRSLAIRPDHGPAWNNLGVALDRLGQKADAEVAYTRAVRLMPENAMAQINLGLIYKQQGRLQDAAACFDAAEKVAPGLAERKGISLRMAPTHIEPPSICVRDTGTCKGRGVYAGKAFKPGEIVESCAVVLIQTAPQNLPSELRSVLFDWGTLCGLGQAQALALGYGSLYNHESPANMRYEANPENLTLNFVAVRPIQAGEELSINYNARGGGEVWDNNNWFERMKISPL